MQVLSVRGLSKRFGDKEVLKNLDLSIPEHSVFGFVGRNGAGKTTAMKAVLGLIRPDQGDILVCGERVLYGEARTNRHVGYLPDVPEFYPFLTAREYLSLCGECMGIEGRLISSRSEELLSLVGLSGETHRIKGFSRGMKQRLGIAQALLAKPRLLICDEPTSALDPIGRREILELLLSVREQTTVLFSTHVLSDVERICTDVAFLSDGKAVLSGSLDALRRTYGRDEFTVEMADEQGVRFLCEFYPDALRTDGMKLVLKGGEVRMYELLDRIREGGHTLRSLVRCDASLESLFMEVTGK